MRERVVADGGDGGGHFVDEGGDLGRGFGVSHFHCGEVEIGEGHEPEGWRIVLIFFVRVFSMGFQLYSK